MGSLLGGEGRVSGEMVPNKRKSSEDIAEQIRKKLFCDPGGQSEDKAKVAQAWLPSSNAPANLNINITNVQSIADKGTRSMSFFLDELPKQLDKMDETTIKNIIEKHAKDKFCKQIEKIKAAARKALMAKDKEIDELNGKVLQQKLEAMETNEKYLKYKKMAIESKNAVAKITQLEETLEDVKIKAGLKDVLLKKEQEKNENFMEAMKLWKVNNLDTAKAKQVARPDNFVTPLKVKSTKEMLSIPENVLCDNLFITPRNQIRTNSFDKPSLQNENANNKTEWNQSKKNDFFEVVKTKELVTSRKYKNKQKIENLLENNGKKTSLSTEKLLKEGTEPIDSSLMRSKLPIHASFQKDYEDQNIFSPISVNGKKSDSNEEVEETNDVDNRTTTKHDALVNRINDQLKAIKSKR